MTIDHLITVALAVTLAPILGALVTGIDRRLTARMQGRFGPPILQPIYDVLKLLRKDGIGVNRIQIIYVCLHLAFIVLVVVLLALGQDMLMILFAYAFSTIALILGGLSVRSPYSRIGSHRKIIQMLAYEPILVIMVIGIYLVEGSFSAGSVMASDQPLLLSLPLVFITFIVAAAIKFGKSPFDIATSHHGHQEIVKGITIEYAGPYLALIEVAHFYEVAVICTVIAMFWATNLYIGAALAAVCVLALVVVDNLFARLTPMWMLRFMWTVPLALASSNVLWLYLPH
jgi:formate hydrogenlyase subunit 4